MSQNSHENGHHALAGFRQQCFLAAEDVGPRDESKAVSSKARKPRSQKRPSGEPDEVPTLALAELLREEFSKLEGRLRTIETLLAETHERVVQGSIVKEYYTTQEVARLLNKRPYTVREWCRLGRVHGEKSHSGRGLDEEWRISHAELTRIQNEGLLQIKRFAAVERPRHVD